jgi:hypothetical protein
VLVCRYIESHVAALRFAKVFEQHELGYDVTVMRGSGVLDASLFFKATRDAVQCFISQIIWSPAVSAVEVGRQSATHLQIPFAIRVRTLIKPSQQLAEGGLGWGPMLLQLRSYSCTVSLGFLAGSPATRLSVSGGAGDFTSVLLVAVEQSAEGPAMKFPITGKNTGNFFRTHKKSRMDCGLSRF